MGALVILFIVVVIIGALLGGNSFGGTIRSGCGCISVVLIIIVLLAIGSLGKK